MAGSVSARIVAFGRFRFDLDTARLFDEHGVLVPGPGKAFETLRALIERRDRIVSKDDLLAIVWPDTVVEEANLAQQIFTLRRLLGDEAGRPAFIATLPRRGYRFVGDVIEVVEPGVAARPGGEAAVPVPSIPSKGRWLALALLLVGSVALATRWSITSGTSGRAVAFDLEMPPGVVARPDLGLAGVSPDGRLVAVMAQRGNEPPAVWIRDISGSDAFALPGSAGSQRPFWSPDSRALGVFQDSMLRVIAIGGGPPRDVCAARGVCGATWSANGTIVFAASTRSPLFKVPAAGGTPTQVTTLDATRRDVSHRYPSFLPDGRHFLFLLWAGDTARQGIYLGDLDGSPPVRLLPDLSPAVWGAGHLFFVRRETLVAHPMPATRLSGEPQVVASSVGRDPSDYVALAATASGDLMFQRGQQRSQLVWFDRSGRRERDYGPPAHWADPAISRDGTHVAFVHRDRAAGDDNLDVWVEDVARQMRTRVTQDPAIDVLPVWSGDGRELLFRSNRSGFSDLYRKKLDTSAPETLVLGSANRKDPTDWSADGTSVLVTEARGGGQTGVWLYDLRGGAPPRPIVQEQASASNARFSPDGRYVAFVSNATGNDEVYAQGLAPGSRRSRVSLDGGNEPAWRGDGRELFFVSHDRAITAVDVSRDGDVLASTAHVLFEVPVLSWLRNGMSVSPNGQHFLVAVAIEEPRPTQVILNWNGRRGQ